MPSKRSGKTQKLARFLNQTDDGPEPQVLQAKKYVANKSIREYGGLTPPHKASVVTARPAIASPTKQQKSKKSKDKSLNQFDALAELEQSPSLAELQLGQTNGKSEEGIAESDLITNGKPQDDKSRSTDDAEINPELTKRDQAILDEAARREQEALDSCPIDDAWKCKPELPTSEEILAEGDVEVTIVPNLIDGPWESTEAYLKTHYDLCREDALGPLIDAVAEFRASPRMNDGSQAWVYDEVYFAGITYSFMGLAMRVTFSTQRAQKNILWDYSSRLMSGDLVAMSPADDCFQRTCIIAVVAARPLEGVKKTPHEVDLYFADPEQADLDPQRKYVMVQSKSGYFEAYRHVLTSLQRMGREKFEFSKYICHLNRDVEVPQYISEKPFFDMSELYGPEDVEHKHVDVLNDWPSLPPTLDQTQWDALRSILTKQLAVIQGPPGTGKTHVSVVALKLLLSPQMDNDAPIIITAQTNHALDQLLRHVAEFESNWIRLGSRSKDSEIRKRTLYNLRRKLPVPPMTEGLLGPAMKKRKQLQGDIKELLSVFSADKAKSLLPAKLFKKLGLITGKQYDNLVEGTKNWVSSTNTGDDPLPIWLGDQRKKFEVHYKESNFGFSEDEIDLEYEQLKELEAEQGIDEEYDEELKGDYMSLVEGYKGLVSKRKRASPEGYVNREADLWKVPESQRGAIYSYLQEKAKTIIRDKFRKLYEEYQKTCYRIKLGKFERDEPLLKSAKIIAMTTTGLNKYRALIQSLRPRTILIEEAAEVIEAPVVAACFDSLEHLILVGDHQQLQGHCTVSELEGEPYYLNVSMFERLVKNDMPFNTLLRQRRMAPAIRQVIKPIYPNLCDHKDVLDRELVPGMGDKRTFFFDHPWYENIDSLSSKYNDGEARMVAMFYRYLRSNGISNEHITVLTFYNGQRKKILRHLRENNELDDGQYLKVVTVDSYQGEENEVIILSLVRNNSGDNIGFLEIENRVCVALSRARRGLYIFGNASCICARSTLWCDVVIIMRDQGGSFGDGLPIVCQTHGNTKIVRNPDDLESSGGGCGEPCNQTLDCGHKCPAPCHGVGHDRIQCSSVCGQELACGHVCNRKCGQTCKCPRDCPPDWERELAVEEAMGIGRVESSKSSRSNDDDIEEVGRGRSMARSPEEAKSSWKDFAKVTRADEKRSSMELQASMTFDKAETWSSTNGTPASSYSAKVPGVTIKQLSKRQVSPNKKGVARFRYEASYTVTHSRTTEVKSEEKVTTEDLIDDCSMPETESNGFVEGPATTDDLIGDLIEL